MDIFRVQLISRMSEERVLQTHLFDNINSALDCFSEMINDLKEVFTDGICHLELWKLSSDDGQFEESEWIDSHQFS